MINEASGRPPVFRNNNTLDNRKIYNTDRAALLYSRQGLYAKEVTAFSYIPSSSKVLDIGCGAGRTTTWLAAEGHDVIGLDFAAKMIEAARSQNPNMSYVIADATAINFKSSRFDVVVFSFNGIDCIPSRAKRLEALREIRRVLKPGGYFIFSSHNHCIPRDLYSIIPFLKSVFKKKRDTFINDSYPWGHLRIYLTTPVLQIQELEKNGFEVLKIVPRKALRKVKSLRLIGLIDSWIYYVCRAAG
jgi:ubiquinone/menaquinone biosynthesis C-methylase UbiE